jgi:hypothetical protein
MNESGKQPIAEKRTIAERQKGQGNELAPKRTNGLLRHADKCLQNEPSDPELLMVQRAWSRYPLGSAANGLCRSSPDTRCEPWHAGSIAASVASAKCWI